MTVDGTTTSETTGSRTAGDGKTDNIAESGTTGGRPIGDKPGRMTSGGTAGDRMHGHRDN